MSDAVARFSGPFIDMFEALRMAPVFARGRRDARAGHVRSLTISSSLVVAQVRGPDETAAHRARIAVRAFGAAEWSRVEDELASQARYAADLLAGRMPPGIEQVFAGAGLSLLPLAIDEIAMDCTCERWPMPCAHVAATLYAAARSFDADPFGVFAWRGRPRDELLHRLHQLRGAAAVEAAMSEAAPAPDASLGEINAFWGGGGTRSAPTLPRSASSFPPAVSSPPAASSPVSPAASAPSLSSAAVASSSPATSASSSYSSPAGSPPAFASGAPSARPAPAVVRPDALLDQLDLPPPLAEILRPAYRALP